MSYFNTITPATSYANMVTLFTSNQAISQLFFVIADEKNGGGYPAIYSYAYNATDATFRLIRFVPQLAN